MSVLTEGTRMPNEGDAEGVEPTDLDAFADQDHRAAYVDIATAPDGSVDGPDGAEMETTASVSDPWLSAPGAVEADASAEPVVDTAVDPPVRKRHVPWRRIGFWTA